MTVFDTKTMSGQSISNYNGIALSLLAKQICARNCIAIIHHRTHARVFIR